jgi:hypothetical protein
MLTGVLRRAYMVFLEPRSPGVGPCYPVSALKESAAATLCCPLPPPLTEPGSTVKIVTMMTRQPIDPTSRGERLLETLPSLPSP